MTKYENFINKKYKLIIFDLDGVLIDSKENMRLSWNAVNQEFNLKKPFYMYFKNIGMPFQSILKKIGIKNNLNQIQIKYSKFSKKFRNNISFYKDVNQTLMYLKKKKYKIGIVTSKDKIRTNLFLSGLSIKFDYVVCPSIKLRGKPYPDQIIHLLKKAKIMNDKSIYIGDTVIDKKAALNAKIDFIFANYGYGKTNSKNILKINSLNKLIKIL